MAQQSKWQNLGAPTLADFETMAANAWDRLPSDFRKMCGDLVIRVEDFADDDVLDELGIEDPFDLMGLYQGVSDSRLLGRRRRYARPSCHPCSRPRDRTSLRIL
jgi:predicted Zn-dependent protease with MMP-like domain